MRKKYLIMTGTVGVVCFIACLITMGYRYLLLGKELQLTQELLAETQTSLELAQVDLTLTQGKLEDAEAKLVETEASLEEFRRPVEYGVAAAPLYDIALSEELQQYTYDTCLVYGIEDYYEVVLAIMWKESTFNPDAVSNGNYGLMQINQVNHSRLVDTLGIDDVLNPKDNIECGVYMLSTLIKDYDDIHLALMAYNMGEGGAAEQWSRGNYTSYYSRDVIAKAESIKAAEISEN